MWLVAQQCNVQPGTDRTPGGSGPVSQKISQIIGARSKLAILSSKILLLTLIYCDIGDTLLLLIANFLQSRVQSSATDEPGGLGSEVAHSEWWYVNPVGIPGCSDLLRFARHDPQLHVQVSRCVCFS